MFRVIRMVFLSLFLSFTFSAHSPKYILSSPPIPPLSTSQLSLDSSVHQEVTTFPLCVDFCRNLEVDLQTFCFTLCISFFFPDGNGPAVPVPGTTSPPTTTTTSATTTTTSATTTTVPSTTTTLHPTVNRPPSDFNSFAPSCPNLAFPSYIGSCLSSEEFSLYNLINEYRGQNSLPPLPLSKTLTTVAQVHAVDSDTNYPTPSFSCNLHSWSSSCPSAWTGGCYTPDNSQGNLMFMKPNEINSAFTGLGFEISAWFSNPITASRALNAWRNSPGHNNLLVENGWGPFGGIGVGIFDNYAHVWFAVESDPDVISEC